jgi:hypothetical protein
MVHIDADLAPDVGSILTRAIHAWSEHLQKQLVALPLEIL